VTTCGGVRVGGGTTTKPRLEAVSKGGHDRSDMTTEPGFLSGESGPATDLEIRRENQDDRDAISQVVAAAFGSEAEARLVEAIRASSSFVPELSLVALLDHRVVGHVMVSAATLRDGENLYRGRCPRRPATWRWISACTRGDLRANELGEPLVVLEGAPAFYGRLGFEYSGPYGIYISCLRGHRQRHPSSFASTITNHIFGVGLNTPPLSVTSQITKPDFG
jgi:putative acetyltransferase